MTTVAAVETRCARHSERAASVTCARCGDYACGACSGSDGKHCAGCQPPDLEQLRTRNLRYEATVKLVSIFYRALSTSMVLFLVSVLLPFCEVGATVVVNDVVFDVAHDRAGPWTVAVAALLFGVAASGLRRLRRWARIGSGVLAMLGVLFGMIISEWLLALPFACALMVCCLPRTTALYSVEYAAAVAATPQLDARSNQPGRLIWMLFGVGLLVLTADLIAMMLAQLQ